MNFVLGQVTQVIGLLFLSYFFRGFDKNWCKGFQPSFQKICKIILKIPSENQSLRTLHSTTYINLKSWEKNHEKFGRYELEKIYVDMSIIDANFILIYSKTLLPAFNGSSIGEKFQGQLGKLPFLIILPFEA